MINIKLDNCDSNHIKLLSLIYPSTTLSVDAQVFTPSRGTPHESTSTDCPHGTHTPTSPYHSASSEAQTPIASGLQTPVLSKEMLQSLGTDPSWVIKVSEKSTELENTGLPSLAYSNFYEREIQHDENYCIFYQTLTLSAIVECFSISYLITYI